MNAALEINRTTEATPGYALDRIGVEFAGRKGLVRALTGVSAHIRTGEFVAIIGRSGSGKSTLLRVLGGLVPATHGSVRLNGAAIDRPPASVRFIAQNYTQSLLPWLTVAQNVQFGVRHAVRVESDLDAKTETLLHRVGLDHAAARYPRELSGGMQQRVAIARALASQPSVLLMDEAFGSVDALSRATLQDLMLELWGALQFTAVLVTHDIDEAVYLADRVFVMDEHGAGLAAIVEVDLDRPRHQVDTREHPHFLAHRRDLATRVLATQPKQAAR